MINITYKKEVRQGDKEVREEVTIENVLSSEVKNYVNLLRNSPNYGGAYVSLPVIEDNQVIHHNIPVVFPNL